MDRATGLFASVKRMAATLVALAHTRVELLTTELEEEIQRTLGILLWLFTALFFGSLFVLMLAVTVLIVFWDTHRVLTASLITAFFLVLAAIMALVARARFKSRPRLLSATIAELKRDRESLEQRE